MSQITLRIDDAEGLRVDRTGEKGRGVFATRRLVRGERMERVAVIVIPDCQREFVDDSFLCDYLFWWEGQMAAALGYGSLYNHSYSPNVRYIKQISQRCIDFVALRDIEAGEELVMNYHGDPTCTDRLWFEVIP